MFSQLEWSYQEAITEKNYIFAFFEIMIIWLDSSLRQYLWEGGRKRRKGYKARKRRNKEGRERKERIKDKGRDRGKGGREAETIIWNCCLNSPVLCQGQPETAGSFTISFSIWSCVLSHTICIPSLSINTDLFRKLFPYLMSWGQGSVCLSRLPYMSVTGSILKLCF